MAARPRAPAAPCPGLRARSRGFCAQDGVSPRCAARECSECSLRVLSTMSERSPSLERSGSAGLPLPASRTAGREEDSQGSLSPEAGEAQAKGPPWQGLETAQKTRTGRLFCPGLPLPGCSVFLRTFLLKFSLPC